MLGGPDPGPYSLLWSWEGHPCSTAWCRTEEERTGKSKNGRSLNGEKSLLTGRNIIIYWYIDQTIIGPDKLCFFSLIVPHKKSDYSHKKSKKCDILIIQNFDIDINTAHMQLTHDIITRFSVLSCRLELSHNIQLSIFAMKTSLCKT